MIHTQALHIPNGAVVAVFHTKKNFDRYINSTVDYLDWLQAKGNLLAYEEAKAHLEKAVDLEKDHVWYIDVEPKPQ